MFKTILFQLLVFFRSLYDYAVDFIFGLMIYDDTKKKIIPPVKNRIVLESATSLAKKIREKELTAETVVRAFIERIEQVNPIINAVVDERFDLAIKESQEIDKYLKTTTDPIDKIEKNKPLLGIPFTTKESTSCKGLNYTFGLLARKGEKGTEDAEVVRLMKEAGGILLGVTNMPELNLWCESRNNLYGQTLNPFNTTRTVGGSSGGEASIISVCGSPIGIGTDIGGSIRMPAFFCGIFGHKPTTDAVSMKGTTRRTGNEKNSMAAAGPMAKYHEDLVSVLKVVSIHSSINETLYQEVDMKTINFYYMEELNDPRVSKVDEELTQILRRAVNYCQDISGVACKKAKFHGLEYSYKLWRYWMTKEPYQFEDELGNRERTVNLWKELPKKLIGKSEFTLAAIYKLIDHKLPQENSIWAEKLTEKLKTEFNNILDNNGVLLCPSSPTPAPYHYTPFLRPFNFTYWALFNIFKFPVTQVPLGLNKEGLPIGIQVVAALNNDKICLEVAKHLQNGFGGWVPPFEVK
ncbi:amidotransferase subunit A, putative [Pediculus humanus corporis]|uniref:Amidotransferase subunit A, putative n=1 Tax=Pediculus humanus subsp. corporis TaxID=121224 RepID=E0VE66_PEDHC|nr:amidotransferase subunit A, putative [Pediculus humanus corporis]EEB11672.1 amidotransferase subunit A, putative [Pediculus humanus corporis]